MSQLPLRVLIVDDEPLAREGMSDYVSRTDFLLEVAQARNGMEALSRVQGEDVDLILLDIQMPGLSGVELVQSLANPPAIIFTSAHPGFAVEGFELNAVDYLLKPISFPRFLKAVLKVRERSNDFAAPPSHLAPAFTPKTKHVFIKEEGRVERIDPATILYAESMQNYCRIHTSDGSYLPLLPLKELEGALPTSDFFRIHRSYLIRLAAVEAIVGNQVRIGAKLLPISRPNREALTERLTGGRLL
ncbi:LytR/AlgR family response regulator transcription factor [Neolewinella antarctica]|uniref:DNA-binding LytR/AlgR family response regulator n=1 Tax=Neolewinella antarctica TaxID=442734 RepID=A0ABX0XAG1_9BACT|nr:LytTR family DNA-binding domain-containing protein [Neolewinella antarctica]NJC25956.1 DNA-binding LytR/AlgR family response regulator [Neolewinella antarctica]